MGAVDVLMNMENMCNQDPERKLGDVPVSGRACSRTACVFMAGLLLVVVVVGCGSERSAAAFCATLKRETTGVQAPGGFKRVLPKLVEHAPEEIRLDMEELARLAKEQPELSGVGGLKAAGAMERVDEYAEAECGMPVFLGTTAAREQSGPADEAVEAALKNLALAQESYWAERSQYTTSLADLVAQGYQPNPDVTVHIQRGDAEGYCMTATNTETGEIFHLSSERGVVTSGGCAG